MKRKIGVVVAWMLLMGTISGCGKNSEKEIDQSPIPEKYITDGKRISFDCEVEISTEYRERRIPELEVKGYFLPDIEKIYQKYVAGKEISENHIVENGSRPEIKEEYYLLEDGSDVAMGSVFMYYTDMAKKYLQAGIFSVENIDKFSEKDLEYKTAQEAIEIVRDDLKEFGYVTEEVDFQSYAVSSEELRAISEQRVSEGRMDEAYDWKSEDDVYAIWGTQLYKDIPVLDESKSAGGTMTKDVPNSAPIMAIYSRRGVEEIKAANVYLYLFEATGNEIFIKSFEEIVKTVQKKYDNIITDSIYTVKKARLYQRVFINERQEYSVEPVWYFEISENGNDSKVMLVNAVDGKEIILNAYF